ncbi:MAG: hypothetical protein DLM58_04545 [Pseudonocardiales bacterium]|nr:MAG: hypothetical protein DLM58_04545 [Pseudonocardiales bacterium]
MREPKEFYCQVWQGDYGAREGFLEALDEVNARFDRDVMTGLTIYWSDIPYELQLYGFVAYATGHGASSAACQWVAERMVAGGARLRTDITGEDLVCALLQRQLNSVGCVQGIRVPDPCHFNTKASLAEKGFDFSPWHSRSRTFLSHQSERKAEVGILQMLLSDRNIPTWMDTCDIEFGESIGVAIERGRAQSTYVIFWISEGFLRSRWCQFEFEAFLHDYASRRSVVLLPVVERGCEGRLPPALTRVKYLGVDAPGDPGHVARQLAPRLTGPPVQPSDDAWG